MTILDFVSSNILSKAEMTEYKAVWDHAYPEDLWSMFNWDEAIQRSSEILQKRYQIEKFLDSVLKTTLSSGDWSVEGQWFISRKIVTLHPNGFERGRFNVRRNAFGSFSVYDGYQTDGWRNIRITANSAGLATWSAGLGKKTRDDAVKQWFRDYAASTQSVISMADARALCRAHLQATLGIPPVAIGERYFQRMFANHMPDHLKLKGRPPG